MSPKTAFLIDARLEVAVFTDIISPASTASSAGYLSAMSKTSPGSSGDADTPAVSTLNPPPISVAGHGPPVVIQTPPSTVSVHVGVVVPMPTVHFKIFPEVVVVP